MLNYTKTARVSSSWYFTVDLDLVGQDLPSVEIRGHNYKVYGDAYGQEGWKLEVAFGSRTFPDFGAVWDFGDLVKMASAIAMDLEKQANDLEAEGSAPTAFDVLRHLPVENRAELDQAEEAVDRQQAQYEAEMRAAKLKRDAHRSLGKCEERPRSSKVRGEQCEKRARYKFYDATDGHFIIQVCGVHARPYKDHPSELRVRELPKR